MYITKNNCKNQFSFICLEINKCITVNKIIDINSSHLGYTSLNINTGNAQNKKGTNIIVIKHFISK